MEKLNGKKLENLILDYLSLPEKRNIGNNNAKLFKYLSSYLVVKGFISGIDILKNSWGFMYSSKNKKIYISEFDISKENYEKYIFRLGKNQNGEYLFPSFGEVDQYRFLHEIGHAYQDFLKNKENGTDINWENGVVNGDISSPFANLFYFCFVLRQKYGIGLSTWGNVSDYNKISEPSQAAIRALEDSNELITMYLWHPKYLETFLDYVSGNIKGFSDEYINHDGYIKLSLSNRKILEDFINKYISEMKRNLGIKELKNDILEKFNNIL